MAEEPQVAPLVEAAAAAASSDDNKPVTHGDHTFVSGWIMDGHIPVLAHKHGQHGEVCFNFTPSRPPFWIVNLVGCKKRATSIMQKLHARISQSVRDMRGSRSRNVRLVSRSGDMQSGRVTVQLDGHELVVGNELGSPVIHATRP